jgi:hypothetical protein
MSTKSAGSSGSEDSYGSNKTAIWDPSYSDGQSFSGHTSLTDMTGDSKASTCTLPESIPCLLRNGKEKDKDKDYPTFTIPFQKFKRLTMNCKRIPNMPKWLTSSGGEDNGRRRAFAYRWFRTQPQRRSMCKCVENCIWCVQLEQGSDTLICDVSRNPAYDILQR